MCNYMLLAASATAVGGDIFSWSGSEKRPNIKVLGPFGLIG